MARPAVAIVETPVGNLASIYSGMQKANASPYLTSSTKDISTAKMLVLPGVGSFGAGMEKLESMEIVQLLHERITNGLPTLAICLGMHLLAKASEESPKIRGIGILDSEVSRFPKSVKTPQLGWNSVQAPQNGKFIIDNGYAYFANSFRICKAPTKWRVAISNYAGPFVSALENDTSILCQFHPELSSKWGIDILRRWIDQKC